MRTLRKQINWLRFRVAHTTYFNETFIQAFLGVFSAVLLWVFITGVILEMKEKDVERPLELYNVRVSSPPSPQMDIGDSVNDCKACKPGGILEPGLVKLAKIDKPIDGTPSVIGGAPSFIRGTPSIIPSSNADPVKVKSSETKSITDSCTGKTYTCNPNDLMDEVAYVYFLNNARGTTVKPQHAIEDLVNLTYFDYTYASVKRLASLTSFPIYILATKSVAEEDLLEYKKLSDTVRVRLVTTKYDKLDIKTDKPYHFHTFGKFEVFNPENTDGKKFLAFMDSDSYALHNVDELFCLPKKFAAAKREQVPVALKSAFNSGVFVYSPSAKNYQGLLDDIVANAGTVWQNGEQSLLNRRFGEIMNCLPVGYNCVGFGAYGTSAKSDK
eukprot:86793-Pyramimonas_sp.AAC.1